MNVTITDKPTFEIVVLVKRFDAATSKKEIPIFWDTYFESGNDNIVTPVLGVCINDTTDNETFSYGIGDFLEQVKHIPKQYQPLTIPSHTWAIFKCVGPLPHAIQDMWTKIYSEWLPNSGYEAIPSYDIEYYSCGDPQSDDNICEIWIPVKRK